MSDREIYLSCPECGEEDAITFTLAWEEGDSNYGADADGNRGISVPGYFYLDDGDPTKQSCSCKLTSEQYAALHTEAKTRAEKYSEEAMRDEPDYDYDDYGAEPPYYL